MVRVYVKDPNERLDYGIDHGPRLPAGDNIAISTWSITPSGLTESSPTFSGQIAVEWLAGGVHGVDYLVKNVSTTSLGRIVEDYLVIQVRNTA